MISESFYWKDELLRQSEWLHNRSAKGRWSAASLAKLERCSMVAAYAIRKLIESHKLTSRIANGTVSAVVYNMSGKPVTLLERHQLDVHFDLSNGRKRAVSIRDFCNQFIHSYVFMPCVFDDGKLDGIFVASHRTRNSVLYFFATDRIVGAWRRVANDEIKHLHLKRTEDGQISIIRSA
jgi:hypothetical protein